MFSRTVNSLDSFIFGGLLQWFFNVVILGPILESAVNWVFCALTFAPQGLTTSAIINSTDPSYGLVAAYLRRHDVWRNSGSVVVSSEDNPVRPVRYRAPLDQPQVFRLERASGGDVWCQVIKTLDHDESQLRLTFLTTDRSILDEFISVIRAERPSTSKPQVTLYTTDTYGWWSPTKTTVRRTLDSLILPTGIKEALVDDVKEFRITQSAWSVKSGVPLRRGYLLYGPEGTGRRSTILALAANLGVGVYIISLSDGTVSDDPCLFRLVNAVPPRSIVLIEDAHCLASFDPDQFLQPNEFPSAEPLSQPDCEPLSPIPCVTDVKPSQVSLAALASVLDGLHSEDGVMFFTTAEDVSLLDSALLRPGRIDVSAQFRLATQDQMVSLFKRFYAAASSEPDDSDDTSTDGGSSPRPSALGLTEDYFSLRRRVPHSSRSDGTSSSPPTPPLTPSPYFFAPPVVFRTPVLPRTLPRQTLDDLAERFACAIPEDTYGVAELQGYLLTKKDEPGEAVSGVREWMEGLREEKARMERMVEVSLL
ncbi:hypothetical protein M407DRAFT_17848 [Tulasnella calospora MUT 4182]|uniref:Uncharacterized protein n=1 Tax=Tulasnella calospora MUT 4182 TaxID=1051891 RepID=A0A0C3QUY2_9AGAM|nr:hypothetical protein M407DRAFT_17848 [Tulasnella calospora MUT 4182]